MLYDYRSGLHEHSSRYDVWGVAAERDNLANFLNGLSSGKILFMAVKDAVTFYSSTALALQRYGVSASFATTSLPRPQCSMANIAYTGQERKYWEKSVNTVGCVGASIIDQTIHIFRELNGRDDCSQEMGIQRRKIPDSGFTASSTFYNDVNHMPYQARLHVKLPGWCSHQSTPVSHYLQIDLGTVRVLSGLVIQSHGTDGGLHYVTKFSIEYSTDNIQWSFYTDDGKNKKVFDGIRIQRQEELRVNWFKRTLARFIRIIPSSRVTTLGVSCMRIELYGCTPSNPIFVYDQSTLNIQQTYQKSVKVHYTMPNQSKANFAISMAAGSDSLAENIDQAYFQSVAGSIVYDNGTVAARTGSANIITNEKTKMQSSAVIAFNIPQANYYSFLTENVFQVSGFLSEFSSQMLSLAICGIDDAQTVMVDDLCHSSD